MIIDIHFYWIGHCFSVFIVAELGYTHTHTHTSLYTYIHTYKNILSRKQILIILMLPMQIQDYRVFTKSLLYCIILLSVSKSWFLRIQKTIELKYSITISHFLYSLHRKSQNINTNTATINMTKKFFLNLNVLSHNLFYSRTTQTHTYIHTRVYLHHPHHLHQSPVSMSISSLHL